MGCRYGLHYESHEGQQGDDTPFVAPGPLESVVLVFHIYFGVHCSDSSSSGVPTQRAEQRLRFVHVALASGPRLGGVANLICMNER